MGEGLEEEDGVEEQSQAQAQEEEEEEGGRDRQAEEEPGPGGGGGGARAAVVTGYCGRVGKAVALALARAGWALHGLDVQDPPPGLRRALQAAGGPRCTWERLSLGDPGAQGAVERALDARGAAVLVHLAAVPDDAPFRAALPPANILGADAVVSAALAVARRRGREGAGPAGRLALLLASSGKVHAGHTGSYPITAATPPAPVCRYGATKMFAEALAQAAAHASAGGLAAVGVRIAWCPRTVADVEAMRADRRRLGPHTGTDEYLSPRDAGACFAALAAAAVEGGGGGSYRLVFCQSRPGDEAGDSGRGRFDLAPVAAACGWQPRDRFPEGLADVEGDDEYVPNPALF